MPTITIAGVARPVVANGLELARTANGMDTIRVSVPGAAAGYRPALDAEVRLTDGAATLFGGVITGAREHGVLDQPVAGFWTEIDAGDYHRLAEERVGIWELPEQTVKARLETLVSSVLGAAGVTLAAGQADGPTVPAAAYRFATAAVVLEDLATASGWVFTIDAAKVLSMYAPGSIAAPFNIAVGDGHTVSDVTVEPTRNEYANRVYCDTGTLYGMAEDAAAQAAIGRIVEIVVASPAETTQETADAIAAAWLAQHLPTLKQVTYETYLDIAPGMTQTINIPARALNNIFLINDVYTRWDGRRLRRRVTATEGLVYQPGWREFYKTSGLYTGGGSSGAAVGGGGAPQPIRYAYPLASGVEAVASPVPTWVPASAMQIQVNTVPRGTLAALVVVSLRALSAGVGVQARIFDLSTGFACTGISALVVSTTFQLATFNATLAAGSHLYRLELLPTHPNEPVSAAGYLE